MPVQLRTEQTVQSVRCEQHSVDRSVERGRLDRARRKWLLAFEQGLRVCRAGRMSIRALSSELCSLVYRIRIVRANSLASSGLNLGPLYGKDVGGHLVLNRSTRACTRDIEDFQKRFPWASLTDLYLYQIAWVEGFESCARQETGCGS